MPKSHYSIFLFSAFVFAPLMSGTAIYALWRGISFIDPAYRYLPIFKKQHVPGFVIYNLPDALYAFALFNTIFFIWQHHIVPQGIIWCFAVFLLLVFSEFLQKWHVIPGTFDWLDITAYATAAVATALTLKYITPHKTQST